MKALNDKQLLVATIAVPVVFVGAFAFLAWSDWQKVHAAEIRDDDVEGAAAAITDPEQWGELRKIHEIEKQIAELRKKADLIPKREQDVIVYREIVQRDSQILPDRDLVNALAQSVDQYARESGVALTKVSDLSLSGGDAAVAIRRMPIRMSLSGNFDQFLKFLNLFESMDRIVNVKSFSVTSNRSDDPSKPPQHGVQLELETYVYNGSAGLAKPIEIANYERRRDDLVIQKLIRQQKAARVDKYQLRQRLNRRDPIVDPRRSLKDVPVDVTPEEYEAQKTLVDRMKIDLELLKEDLRLEALYVAEKKYVQLAQIRPIIQDKVREFEAALREATRKVTVIELAEILTDEIGNAFAQIRDQRKHETGPVLMDRREVQGFLDSMRQFAETAAHEQVVKRMKEFEGFAKNKKLTEDAEPLVAEMRDMAAEAQVMLDFLSLDIKVVGVIRQEQGSRVILNGKSRKVGDVIDAAGRCRLAAIKDESLVFDFDGFEIEHVLKKN